MYRPPHRARRALRLAGLALTIGLAACTDKSVASTEPSINAAIGGSSNGASMVGAPFGHVGCGGNAMSAPLAVGLSGSVHQLAQVRVSALPGLHHWASSLFNVLMNTAPGSRIPCVGDVLANGETILEVTPVLEDTPLDDWARSMIETVPPGITPPQWLSLPLRTRFMIWKIAGEIANLPASLGQVQASLIAMTLTKDFLAAVTWAYQTTDRFVDHGWNELARDMSAAALMRCKCNAALHNNRFWGAIQILNISALDDYTGRLVTSYFERPDKTIRWAQDRASASRIGSDAIHALVQPITRAQDVDGSRCVEYVMAGLRHLSTFSGLIPPVAPEH